MRIARVTGMVTASVKQPKLAGHKFLVVDIEDGEGNRLEASVVAVDTVGAGVGEHVLVGIRFGGKNSGRDCQYCGRCSCCRHY